MAKPSRELILQPLTRQAFEPFGDVITTEGANHFEINNGTTMRFHDLARVSALGTDARIMISIFRGQEFSLPVEISMLERHPFGSQAFIPLQHNPFLVVVAKDHDGVPGKPQAFMAEPGQGVNYLSNVWHHPLISLGGVSDFAVIDRDGQENNLEEYFFDEAFLITGN